MTALRQPVRNAAADRLQALALATLGVACIVAFVVVVVLGTRLTFFNDDWYFLLQRPGLESHGGLDALLAPHNSNLVVLPAAIYKLLVALFGLSSQLPFRIVLGLAIVAVAVALFLLVRERAGPGPALAGAVVVLFLGAAWEDLLFFASIDLIGSLATGLAALRVLERERPQTEAVACLLLICSVGFSNVGVPFAIGGAAAILLRRRPERLWVAAIPLALFGLWWVLQGDSQPSHLSAGNLEHLPRYVVDSTSAGLASAGGLGLGTSATYTRGRILLAVLAVVLVVVLIRGWRPARSSVLVPILIALSFWCLTGASFIPGREPFASRYQLIDVALLIWTAAELVGPIRLGRVATGLLACATIAITWSNVDRRLAYGYRFLRTQSGFVKADLGALELARGLAPPNLWLVSSVAHNPYLSGITAGRLFAETAAHGRPPADTPSQLATAPPAQRQSVDNVLARAERLRPSLIPTRDAPGRGCARLETGRAAVSREQALVPGTWTLRDEGGYGLAIGVRRFGPPGTRTYVGLIGPGEEERMAVPSDGAHLRWLLSIKAAGPTSASSARLCRT